VIDDTYSAGLSGFAKYACIYGMRFYSEKVGYLVGQHMLVAKYTDENGSPESHRCVECMRGKCHQQEFPDAGTDVISPDIVYPDGEIPEIIEDTGPVITCPSDKILPMVDSKVCFNDVTNNSISDFRPNVGFAEIMLKKKLSPEKMLEYLQIIYSNGIFMMQLISDILDFAKIETGHFKLRKNYFSINRLIYDIMVIFLTDLQIRRKEHIALLFNHGLADGSDMIIADEVRIRKVLVNLISNAIKFTEKGSITIGYTVKGDFLEFYVKDTGIGIEKEALDNIFDRYIQANRKINSTYGGSGIGLSIVKDIITLHGGKIWAESELQVGTTFYFTIPYETKNSNV
jgi:anti-sigma regulatory factor (Ser/Thr protein kinase)